MPFKSSAARMSWRGMNTGADFVHVWSASNYAEGAINTIGFRYDENRRFGVLRNTDAEACGELFPMTDDSGPTVAIVGTGGVARAVAIGGHFDRVEVYGRTKERAEQFGESLRRWITPLSIDELANSRANVFVNCTPVGMAGGPDPDGMPIPVDDIKPAPETVFFDTVYNPIETPMLKAAKRWGCRTIDGVEMFVRQAALQFELWTGEAAPVALFDRLVRERLS
jgi:shikimate 5-dehydrogenase